MELTDDLDSIATRGRLYMVRGDEATQIYATNLDRGHVKIDADFGKTWLLVEAGWPSAARERAEEYWASGSDAVAQAGKLVVF